MLCVSGGTRQSAPGFAAGPPPKFRVWPPRDVALAAKFNLQSSERQSLSRTLCCCVCVRARKPLAVTQCAVEACRAEVYPKARHWRTITHPLHSDVWIGSQACLAHNWEVTALPAISVRIIEQPLRHGAQLPLGTPPPTARVQQLFQPQTGLPIHHTNNHAPDSSVIRKYVGHISPGNVGHAIQTTAAVLKAAESDLNTLQLFGDRLVCCSLPQSLAVCCSAARASADYGK